MNLRSLRTYRLILACVLMTLSLLAWVGRAFAQTAGSGSNKVSCVATMTGYTGGGTISWTGSTAKTVRLKCHYTADLATAVAGLTARVPATNNEILVMDLLPSGGGVICARTSSYCAYTRPVGAGFTVNVNDTSARFFDVQMSLTRTSTATVSLGALPTSVRLGWDTGTDINVDVGFNSATNDSATVAWVAEATFSSTNTLRYYGTAPYSPIVPFCGAEVDWTDPLVNERVFDGDVLAYDYTRTATVTGNIEVRWNPGLAGLDAPGPWFLLLSEATISTSGTGTITVGDQGAFDGRLLASAEMRCYDQRTDAYVYKKAGDPSSVAGDGVSRPCESTRVTWPQMATLEMGDDVSWYFSHRIVGYTGDPDVLVEYATWDDGNLDGPGNVTSLTWSTLVDLSPGEFGDYTAAAGFDGTTRQFLLRCTDDQGVMYGSPWSSSGRLGNPAAGGEESCYAQSGIGLRPSSWVPGLWRMGSCTMTVLFVPTDPGEWIDDQRTMLSEDAPFSFVADAVSFFDVATDPDGPAVSGCLGDLTIGSTTDEVCYLNSTTTGVLDSQTWIRPFIWFCVVGLTVLGFLLSTFRMFLP